MSIIVFNNLLSRQDLTVGRMLYLDDSDGFDEDFCSSAKPGDELGILQAKEPGVSLFGLRYATCEVRKADYSGIDAEITTVMRVDELVGTMPVQDDFSVDRLLKWTHSYIDRAGEGLLMEKLPFNIPQKSMFEEARAKQEVLIEGYHNSLNTIYVRFMPSSNLFRILYIRHDRKWYNMLYDLFRADDLFRDIEQYRLNARNATEKAYWEFFLH